MVEQDKGAWWSALDGVSKMWPVIIAVVMLIGGIYGLHGVDY